MHRDSSFMFWKDAGNTRDPVCRKHTGFYPGEVYGEWKKTHRSQSDLSVYRKRVILADGERRLQNETLCLEMTKPAR